MPVSLGFLEECESWRLQSRFFPSKVGGKPAWLSGSPLPTAKELTCEQCLKTTTFLCQVYAPFDFETSNTELLVNNFHRTIFVFICNNAECTAPSIKVFRSSLPRINDFYPSEPPADNPDTSSGSSAGEELCNLCGIAAHQRCSQCKKVVYCCKDHQVIDWKDNHKKQCNSENGINSSEKARFLFSEWELVNEIEDISSTAVDERKAMEEFSKLKMQGKTGTLADVSEADLEAHMTETSDKVFTKFKERIADFPDQVIRYDRGGEPLLIAKHPIPIDIPKCEHCNSPRQFELQIMPQMIYELKEEHLDWGVLLIYTCKSSCTGNSVNSYKKEYVFRQDVSTEK